MAIVVLVLWLFTAGAGFYLLVTSNLSRARPAAALRSIRRAPAPDADPPRPQSPPAAAQARRQPAPGAPPPRRAAQPAASGAAARDRFAPPSLVAARNAPVLPGLRSLLEFAHPACASSAWVLAGLYVRALPGAGLDRVRAGDGHRLPGPELVRGEYPRGPANARQRAPRVPVPSFSTRLVALHGGAAAVTFVLAALTALVLGR